MDDKIKLYNDDCFLILPDIQSESIDCIILDPPYGTTSCDWDIELNFTSLWIQYNRIIKNNGVILIFGQEPFSSFVRLSNIENYKYDWYWEKERLTNVFQVKRRPGKTIETISVFYKDQCQYFPQKQKHLGKKVSNKIRESAKFSETLDGKHSTTRPLEYKDDGTRYPTQVIRVNRDSVRENIHPTQKPMELMDFLISTYTKKCDVVLDNCMGSGTTAISCIGLDRKFIGVEKNPIFFEKAQKRIESNLKIAKRKIF